MSRHFCGEINLMFSDFLLNYETEEGFVNHCKINNMQITMRMTTGMLHLNKATLSLSGTVYADVVLVLLPVCHAGQMQTQGLCWSVHGDHSSQFSAHRLQTMMLTNPLNCLRAELACTVELLLWVCRWSSCCMLDRIFRGFSNVQCFSPWNGVWMDSRA